MKRVWIASWVAMALLGACAAAQTAPPGETMDLVGSRWRLHAFADGAEQEPVVEDVDVTLNFDATRISGTGGCNRYGASYELSATNLTFGNVMSTRMACPGPRMQVERRFFEALRSVARHQIRDQQLWLHGPNNTSLVFNRTSRQD